VKFPVTVEYYDQRAKIYTPAKGFPFYRVAFRVAGKRRMLTFATYGEAKKAAEDKVKELHKGQQSSALTAKQAQDALTVFEMLTTFRQETGKIVSVVEMTGNYISAVKQLPKDCSLPEAVRVYCQSISTVQRKPLADAVIAFCAERKPKTVVQPGKKRPALNPTYFADTSRQLNEFADSFPGNAVCDLTKAHLDAYVNAHPKLSAKSRNHLRTTVRMFLGWCVRNDYLAANHRLLEATGLKSEELEDAPIDYYRPKELRTLLEHSSDKMRHIFALQALGGLRLQEALRLDWCDVFKIPGQIEINSSKSKNRQRRLVDIGPALKLWLAPYRGKQGNIATQTLNGYTAAFTALRRSLKIPPRRNGLRHGFVTFHFALHQNENLTAAQAGHSPTMLHANYNGLGTKAEAKKWFNVMPNKPKK